MHNRFYRRFAPLLAMIAFLRMQFAITDEERRPLDTAAATTGGLSFGGGDEPPYELDEGTRAWLNDRPGGEVGIASEGTSRYPDPNPLSLDDYDFDLLEVALEVSRSDPTEFRRLAQNLGYRFTPVSFLQQNPFTL